MWPGWASFAARRGFELFVFTSKGFDGLSQLPIFPLVIDYLFIGQSGEFQSTEQRPLPALFFAESADLGIAAAPSGIDGLDGVRNRFRSVRGQAV